MDRLLDGKGRIWMDCDVRMKLIDSKILSKSRWKKKDEMKVEDKESNQCQTKRSLLPFH